MNVKPAFRLLLSSLLITLWTGHRGEIPSVSPAIAAEQDCGTENYAFKPGEEIVYKIYYHLSPLWLTAGEVSFKVEDTGSDYRFKVVGFTYNSLEWFYKGVYTFESEVDKESLMPHQFVRTIQEKKFSKYNKFVFDQNKGRVTTWQGKTSKETEQKVKDIGPCMHDMISVLYYVRNLNFDQMRVGESFPVDIFLEEKYPLNIHVLGKNEEKRIKGLGKQMTHVFSPEVITGDVFHEDTQMSIWVSADQNKIPLMIESPVRVGKIRAVLQSYKGLRHQFKTGE